MNDSTSVTAPWFKFATAWGAATGAKLAESNFYSYDWWLAHAAQISALLAAAYTFLLITDWWWKRWWKPLFLRLGWIKGKPRSFMDATTDKAPFDDEPTYTYKQKGK